MNSNSALCIIVIIQTVTVILLLLRLGNRGFNHRARRIEWIMSKTLNIGGTSTATITAKDAQGNTVTLPSAPSWSVDNSAIATIAPAADGMSAVVTAVAVGTATITVKAEGDPTPGVDTLTATGTVNVVDEASALDLTFS